MSATLKQRKLMTVAPKGTRHLRVDGVQYRYAVTPSDEQGFSVVVARATVPSRRLVCSVGQGVTLSPSLVRRAILDAIAAGWVPTVRGSDFHQRVAAASDAPSELYQCPVCDFFTLPRRNEFEICPVCFWEYDGLDVDTLDQLSGPNHLTLRVARDNFHELGAYEPAMVASVLDERSRQRYRSIPR